MEEYNREIIEEEPQFISIAGSGDSYYLTVNLHITKIESGYECESTTVKLDHFPVRADVVKAATDYVNAKTDYKILTGFVWRKMPVWLSAENQFNFKAAYDLAYQTGGASLPARYKLGEDEKGDPIYYDFMDVETFQDFYLSAIAWIQQCINDGWKEKDSIDYGDLKLQGELP